MTGKARNLTEELRDFSRSKARAGDTLEPELREAVVTAYQEGVEPAVIAEWLRNQGVEMGHAILGAWLRRRYPRPR